MIEYIPFVDLCVSLLIAALFTIVITVSWFILDYCLKDKE